MTPAGDSPPAPKKALRATEVVGQKRQARHGDSRIFAPGSRQSESRTRLTRRNQDLLAPVLRQGIPPVPAGTALYARPRSRLARQAPGVLAPAFELFGYLSRGLCRPLPVQALRATMVLPRRRASPRHHPPQPT